MDQNRLPGGRQASTASTTSEKPVLSRAKLQRLGARVISDNTLSRFL